MCNIMKYALIPLAVAAALLTTIAVSAAEGNEKTVFITSTSYESNLGGLKGADDKCQAVADSAASIVPSGTYLAWLSDVTDSPDTRFTKSSHPYILPDGTKIAENYTDLTDGSILHTINVGPTGKPIGVQRFWTGTKADGTAAKESHTCFGWKDHIANSKALVGGTEKTSTLWSERHAGSCFRPKRLACFQQ